MDTVLSPDMPYGKARIRDDFGYVFSKLMEKQSSDPEITTEATAETLTVRHTRLPFTVIYYRDDAAGGQVYFEAKDWFYKLAVYQTAGHMMLTHKRVGGDMDKMVEDLISAKLTL